ncbi:alkene reductase [Pengzhenrongella sp.]|jgi:N-ethylmaleimide reductase|uniref:alkene reductase n=1 Tax=Pengzhenrongella sp. TaxID=2888820 RepID=UPI002F91D750
MSTAFDPVTVGGRTLANRIVMSPMTRSRAFGPGATPTELMATYYAQRASAGLIITEGIQPSFVGQGYPDTPGLHSEAQVQEWAKITAAVHENGGLIFAQLMHSGRIGHSSLYAEPMNPVGPSPVAAKGSSYTHDGPKDLPTPRELTAADIAETIADFVSAARNAIAAGFDGVELHGANGYLLHQFLSTNANLRDDEWGGSVESRIRLTVEVARAVVDAIGADRTGLRISPANPINDIVEDDYQATYPALLAALNPLGLAFLHVLESADLELTAQLRAQWNGTFLLNPATPGSFTGLDQLRLIEDGAADLLSFGALFLANPDLPARLAVGGPFNAPDFSTAFGGDAHGFTDYPTLDEAAAA